MTSSEEDVMHHWILIDFGWFWGMSYLQTPLLHSLRPFLGSLGWGKFNTSLEPPVWTDRIQHDVISYNATITACERPNHWQRALQILHSMPGSENGEDVERADDLISRWPSKNGWLIVPYHWTFFTTRVTKCLWTWIYGAMPSGTVIHP